MPDPSMKEIWGADDCGICGEPFRSMDEEVGEFVTDEPDTEPAFAGMGFHKHVIAHAQCGLDKGYELA